jgi:hypothetical protein
MDLSAVAPVLYTVGGVIGKGMWDRFWKNRDRTLDRDNELSERHRSDLSAAYAQLIIAHTNVIDRGLYVLSALQQLDQQRETSRFLLLQSVHGPEQRQRAQEAGLAAIVPDRLAAGPRRAAPDRPDRQISPRATTPADRAGARSGTDARRRDRKSTTRDLRRNGSTTTRVPHE